MIHACDTGRRDSGAADRRAARARLRTNLATGLYAGLKHGAAGAVAAATLAAAAQAQDAQGGADAPVELEAIRVEQAGAQRVLGNAEIDEDAIARRNPATAADVFKGESAIQTGGGAAIAQKVIVNGVEESLLSVTIDGARQNKSAFHHTGNVLLDPALLKAVEVSSGLAPADAGPGAVGGVLAYTTKDATDLLDPEETWGGMLTLSGATNPAGFRSTLSLYGAAHGAEVLVSATRQKGEDYEDGDGTEIRGTGPDLAALLAKLAFETEGGSRFAFSVSDTEDSGLRAAQAGPGGLYFARPDFTGVVGRDTVMIEATSRRRSAAVTYEETAPTGQWDPKVQLAWNRQETDAGGAEGENDSFSALAQNRFQLFGGVLTAGVDAFHDTARGTGQLTVGDAEETLSNIGLFAQMRHDAGDRVSLSYGARIDAQRFELADGRSFEDAGVSLNAAADVALTETLTATIGAASVWGGHELSEASLINLNSEWSYGDPEPSRALNARAGLRWESGPWALSGALFRTEVRDVNDILNAARARSDLKSRGVDLSASWTGARGFARVSYTYAHVTLDDASIGSTAYYIGRPMGHVLGFEAAWDVTDEVRLGGAAEAALDNNEGAVNLPGYLGVDLYAEYRPDFAPNLGLRAEVRNAFDATYARRGSDGIDSSRIAPLTEPGRSLALTVNLQF